jgi:hypothetical protein
LRSIGLVDEWQTRKRSQVHCKGCKSHEVGNLTDLDHSNLRVPTTSMRNDTGITPDKKPDIEHNASAGAP